MAISCPHNEVSTGPEVRVPCANEIHIRNRSTCDFFGAPNCRLETSRMVLPACRESFECHSVPLLCFRGPSSLSLRSVFQTVHFSLGTSIF